MTGWFSLSFYRVGPDTTLTQLRSQKIEYPNVDEARAAAKEALERFPHVTYVSINHQPLTGSIRSIERVEREK
jgi:hypothetical protein